VEYSNRNNGTWDSTPFVVEQGSLVFNKISIAMNEDNIPELVYINSTDDDLTAARLGYNDSRRANSVTLKDVDLDVNDISNERGATIAVDTDGNTWIAYVDDTDEIITLARHDDADGWTSSWTFASKPNTEEGLEPHVVIDGTYVYVFYEGKETGTLDDIMYDRYDGSSWAGEVALETGTYQNGKAKWSSYYNNHGQAQIDYLFDDGTDVFYNWFSLGEPPTWKAKDACKLDKCLEFDGTNDVVAVSVTHALDLNDNLAPGFTFSAWVYADTAGEGTGGQIFLQRRKYLAQGG